MATQRKLNQCGQCKAARIFSFMSIESIAADAAVALRAFTEAEERRFVESIPSPLNAADRMRMGPRAEPIHVQNVSASHSIAQYINYADINGSSRPGLQRAAIHPNHASDEDMMKTIFRVETDPAPRQIRLED